MTYVIKFDDRPEPVAAPDANPKYGFPATTTQGRPGLSAYELAVQEGYSGTAEEFATAQAAVPALEGRVTALEQGGGGDAGAALVEHINAEEPHPAYDLNMPDLDLIFENGLI